MSIYKWKSGSRIHGDPQEIGEVCERLDRSGNLTPMALVDEGRDPKSPLHGCFEWDDASAAEKYREVQAGRIIRSIVVDIEGVQEPTRAFVSVAISDDGNGKTYMGVEAALSNEETRECVLASAIAELKAFERKYAHLEELAQVITAIRRVA